MNLYQEIDAPRKRRNQITIEIEFPLENFGVSG